MNIQNLTKTQLLQITKPNDIFNAKKNLAEYQYKLLLKKCIPTYDKDGTLKIHLDNLWNAYLENLLLNKEEKDDNIIKIFMDNGQIAQFNIINRIELKNTNIYTNENNYAIYKFTKDYEGYFDKNLVRIHDFFSNLDSNHKKFYKPYNFHIATRKRDHTDVFYFVISDFKIKDKVTFLKDLDINYKQFKNIITQILEVAYLFHKNNIVLNALNTSLILFEDDNINLNCVYQYGLPFGTQVKTIPEYNYNLINRGSEILSNFRDDMYAIKAIAKELSKKVVMPIKVKNWIDDKVIQDIQTERYRFYEALYK